MIRKILCPEFKKKQLFCFFLFLPAFLFSQNKIDGSIKDTYNVPIAGANIILKKTNNDDVVTYTTSNPKGYFTLQVKKGTYLLKISYLGFETFLQNIEVLNTDFQLRPIILKENSTELEEVIIKAENNGIVQKDDVTQYKIEAFLNGTEETLKDIITKLPGLGINENGKITANGKEIDRLLIDGENLYKRQHQLATENINSEMVKNAELIRNYKDFESINPNEKTGITALNINIKDTFKNKFTGNLEAHTGIEKRYKINASLFNFNKKAKFSLISNSNNLGETTMSIEDYYALTDSDARANKKGGSKVTFAKLEDLPRFLNANNNVAALNNNFVTLSSITNLSKKIKLDFYGIFNQAKQIENSNRVLLFNNKLNPEKILENNHIEERNYLGIFQLKSVYKPNKSSVLTLYNTLNIDNINQEKTIENTTNSKVSFISEINTPKKIDLHSELSYSKRINANLLNTSVSLSYLEARKKKQINSNAPFLNIDFIGNNYSAHQTVNKSLKETKFDINYTLNYNTVSIDFYNKTSFSNNNLTSNTNNLTDFQNRLVLNQWLTKNGTDVTFSLSKKINYTLGVHYNYVSNNVNHLKNNVNYIGANSSIKAEFNSNNIAQLSYNYSNSLALIDHLNTGFIISDYRNVFKNEDINYKTLFPYHQISASHFIFKPKMNLSYIFNASYTTKNKAIGNNIIHNENLTLSKNKIINQDNMFHSFVFIDKKLKKTPLSISGSLSYNTNQQDYFQNDIVYHFKSQNISSIIKFKSHFKKSFVHIDMGYKFSKDNYKGENNNSFLKISQPYINTNGKISKTLFWYLNTNLTYYESSNQNRNLFILSPRFRYTQEKSKWEFYLTGNNILNLNTKSIIKNNSSPSYTEEKTSEILAGYILLGAKIKF